MAVALSSSVNRWSRVTPSDIRVDATGNVTPATSTEWIKAASCRWLAVPNRITSNLSVFRSRLFARYQSCTVVEHARSLPRWCAESLVIIDKYSCMSSAYCWYRTPKLSMTAPTGATYAANSSSPRTDPWSALERQSSRTDEWLPSRGERFGWKQIRLNSKELLAVASGQEVKEGSLPKIFGCRKICQKIMSKMFV